MPNIPSITLVMLLGCDNCGSDKDFYYPENCFCDRCLIRALEGRIRSAKNLFEQGCISEESYQETVKQEGDRIAAMKVRSPHLASL